MPSVLVVVTPVFVSSQSRGPISPPHRCRGKPVDLAAEPFVFGVPSSPFPCPSPACVSNKISRHDFSSSWTPTYALSNLKYAMNTTNTTYPTTTDGPMCMRMHFRYPTRTTRIRGRPRLSCFTSGIGIPTDLTVYRQRPPCQSGEINSAPLLETPLLDERAENTVELQRTPWDSPRT
ncbi:hypothetical protein HD554DRAFT_1189039 [Boletus coccyginus]|nr:hypothetical protein HD554DRAFT_1189039 [Boletus coccyginus]